jgi:hypothetical protein
MARKKATPRPNAKEQRHPLVQETIRALHEQISKFIAAVEMGDKPDQHTLEMLAAKLQAWLKGEDVRRLFPKLTRGGPVAKPETAARRRAIALYVARKIQSVETELDAIDQVAEERGLKSSTVKAAYNRHRSWARKAASGPAPRATSVERRLLTQQRGIKKS